MATVKVAGAGGINTRAFRDVAKALKKAQPAMRLELLRSLRAAGDLVAKDAKSIVSDYSTSIPPTIKTRVRGVGVAVQAGGSAASQASVARGLFTSGYGSGASTSRERRAEEGVVIAGLFELGNTGGAKSASASRKGVFRHPVFGDDDTWVDQPMHPFLVPAGDKNRVAIDALVFEALQKVTEIVVLED